MSFLFPFVYPFLLWKSPRIGLVALTLYVACYIPLGMRGEYRLSNHGGQHWRRLWCPDHMTRDVIVVRVHVQHTNLGALFWPCLMVDRLVWHPDRDPYEGIERAEPTEGRARRPAPRAEPVIAEAFVTRMRRVSGQRRAGIRR